MTDAQYNAKLWLNRAEVLGRRVEVERRTLEVIQSKLCGVSNYEQRPKADGLKAMEAHENALIDYSLQRQRLERAQAAYIDAVKETHEVIEELPEQYKPLAIDRYINGLKWEKLEELHNYSASQLYEHNKKILDYVAQILAARQREKQTQGAAYAL